MECTFLEENILKNKEVQFGYLYAYLSASYILFSKPFVRRQETNNTKEKISEWPEDGEEMKE